MSSATSGRDGTVRQWDPLARGLETVLDAGRGSVTALVEDARGRLRAGTRSGCLGVVGEELAPAFDAAVLDLAALPDGTIAAALSSGEVAVVEVGGALRSRRAVHDGWTWSVAPAGGGAVRAGESGLA